MTGRIFDIKRFAVHDGPGIRTTVFFKGCPLRCWWCHNPESFDMKPIKASKRVILGDKIFDDCEIIGRDYSLEELMVEISKDEVFYKESGGGVTFSGGEPLLQFDFLLALCHQCRQKAISVTLDTSGYTDQETFKKILPEVDIFLFDLKIMDETNHKRYAGSSNQKILKNLKLAAESGKRTIIRYPLIPGINDDQDNIEAMAAEMKNLCLTEINILPYHRIAGDKYQRLNLEEKLPDLEEPDDAQIERVREFFAGKGFTVKIGG